MRKINEIAQEIRNDWKTPYFGAVPYLNAMFELRTLDDKFIYESAREIVVRFLANAGSWRGETARRIKKELKEMLKKK
jgi:hypothetical protein